MVGNSGRSRRARWASRRTSNGLCAAGVVVGQRRHPLAHRRVAGAVGDRAGPRAPGRWRRARRRSPRGPRRGRGRGSRPRRPSACANAIQERSSSSSTSEGGSASRSTGVCRSEHEVETTSSAQRSRRPPSRSRLCSSSLIQTLRPSTIPANSHLSSRPPSLAISSTFSGPRAPCSGRGRPAAVEVEPDALDREVAEHAVGVADVVEVGLDADPGALVDLGQLLVGEAQRVELALGAVLDEAGLVELHPGRALLGEALDHLAVDLEQRLEQAEAVEVLGHAVGGLAEQQERDRPDDHGHGVDPQLLHRLGVLVEGLRRRQRELVSGPSSGTM